jgi:hypothetical protein
MSNFFQRWSKLKQSQTVIKEEVIQPSVEIEVEQSSIQVNDNLLSDSSTEAYEGPTMADVEKLNQDSDFSSFTATGANDEVHHAAMKKLFSDPHYNVMDGLDIYIDDYSKEDPLPLGMLEKMNQSSMLGLFKKAQDNLLSSTTESENISPPNSLPSQSDSDEISRINLTEDIDKEKDVEEKKNV